MKSSLLVSGLVWLATASFIQAVLGQEPTPAPIEASPPQQVIPAESAVPVGKASAALTLPSPAPAPLVQPGPSPELSYLQEHLRWAEEEARSAQRNIPLLILLVLFALPVSFAGGVFFARYKHYQQLNQTLRALMEKGTAIPPEILTPAKPTGPTMSDFRKGLLLVWSGVGAVFLLGIILNGSRAWSLGLIPIFTGVAYLVLWRLERRKETA